MTTPLAKTPTLEPRQAAPDSPVLLEYLHSCPICGAVDLRHYCRVPSLFRAGEYIRYDRCADCGVVLRNPRLPPATRVERYETSVPAESWWHLDARAQIHYRMMMRRLARLHAPNLGRRLLDFGCGAGGFLLEARAAGFEVSGLELSRAMAAYVSEAHGVVVYQGLIGDESFARERFDVIVSSQVFEHLVDPRQTLQDLRRHLNPAGLLLIEVPNLRHVKERLRRGSTMDDSHLFYFSGFSLSRLLGTNGFRVLRVEEGVRLYRAATRTERAPMALHALAERACSVLGIKTGLSVFARLV